MIQKSLLNAKLRASCYHFLISLSVFVIVVLWAWLYAYPSAYFSMSGAMQGLALVFFVDVVLGPLLSLLVYNPNKPKKEIISDFVIIGMVQLAALGYGLYVLNHERPRVLLIYPDSTATVITHRELMGFSQQLDLTAYSKIAGLPAAVYASVGGVLDYRPLSEASIVIAQTDVSTRQSIADLNQDVQTLQSMDSKYKNPYILSVMAKYNGAYFVLDKDFVFLDKFGERPVS